MSNHIDQLDNLLRLSYIAFGPRLILISSFGPTSMVMIDRIAKLGLPIEIATIDTGELFPETYALKERVEHHYNLNIRVIKADATTPGLWQTDPDACCRERKVNPLRRILAGYDAWLTGLRRDQATTRSDLQPVAWDEANHLVKIAPLADWNRNQVWGYLLLNDVPYNALHNQGYKSIGCRHCTLASAAADERSGRWAGLDKVECGIHRHN